MDKNKHKQFTDDELYILSDGLLALIRNVNEASKLVCSSKSLDVLEKEILKIPSPNRGGGFIAKSALNNIGITSDLKGILTKSSIKDLILSSEGKLQETLIKIKNILDIYE